MGTWVLLFTLFSYFFSLGVYTSYKPYLNRDEEIIKQLQKVIAYIINLNFLVQVCNIQLGHMCFLYNNMK